MRATEAVEMTHNPEASRRCVPSSRVRSGGTPPLVVGCRALTARLGADDLDVFLDPQPRLLRLVSGIEPEPGGLHVLLEPFGVRSTQRLAISPAPRRGRRRALARRAETAG